MIEDGIRHRRKSSGKSDNGEVTNRTNTKHLKFMTAPESQATKYLSYVDRVPFARRKKPDSWFIFGLEIVLVCAAIFGCYATYYYVDQLHLPIARFYATIGVRRAQSLLGQHLLQNAEGQEDLDEAIHWMKKAAQNGDPISSYNLAIAHLKNHVVHDRLEEDQIMQMINHAADNGIDEAQKLRMHCKAKNQCPKLNNQIPKYSKKI